jgi:glycine hydroxymethyltransferase
VQGSVILHSVAGKAACLGETLRPEFKIYNQAVLDNARALASARVDAGLRGGIDTALMLVDLAARNITGDVATAPLKRAGLAVNKNLIPFDPRPPEAPSGLRLSSNAGTTRGFGVPEFRTIRSWIDRALADPTDAQTFAAVRQEVRALCEKHPIY